MNTIQFHHDQEHRRTIAVKALFNKSTLMQTITAHAAGVVSKLTVGYGVAYCNPEDNFCKATGRQVSESKILSTTFSLYSLIVEDDTSILSFKNEQGEIIMFSVCSFSEKVHFIEWMPELG